MTVTGNVVSYSQLGTPGNYFPSNTLINGPDGNVWFSNWTNGTIGKITPQGGVQEYNLTNDHYPVGMAAGPDGNIWAALFSSNLISKITPAGSVSAYTLPAGTQWPYGLTLGNGANFWFGYTSLTTTGVGKIDMAGNITTYPTPRHYSPTFLGADGNIWGLSYDYVSFNGIGKITPAGQVTEYPLTGYVPNSFVRGVGNAMWTFDAWNGKISKITTDGQITEYPLLGTQYGSTSEMILGPDGNIWFFGDGTNFDLVTDGFFQTPSRLGRITPSGEVMEAVLPTQAALPNRFVIGPDNKLWFTEFQGALVRVDGLVPNKSFTGNTAPATGTTTGAATIAVTGGSANCDVTSNSFVSASSVAAPPVGVNFPHGVVRFETSDCGSGTTLTVTLTFPQALPSEARLYKYGPPAAGQAPQWYVHPATISGNTIVYTVTDGGAGDSDSRAGYISDPGGPGVPAEQSSAGGGIAGVPTLSEWALMLLAGLLGVIGMTRSRQTARGN